MAETARDIFISYSSRDEAVAGLACTELEKAGYRCWFAARDITPGEHYAEEIMEALRESQALLLFFSEAANDSPHVEREIDRAIARRLPLLAVRLDRAEMSPKFLYYLSVIQWLDVTDARNNEERVIGLSARVESILANIHLNAKRASANSVARFGDFEILATPEGRPIELGRGGMGVTYRARQLSMPSHKVALKVINPDLLGNDLVRRRFLREAALASEIDSHPNVAVVYGQGQEGDSLYYAMQLVDGIDLDRYVKGRGPLSVNQALSVVGQVASALEAANAKGLIHRDIKPSNIMAVEGRRRRLRIKLIDFGLAKNLTQRDIQNSLSGGDQFMGTLPFASPEQCRGQEVDGRSDLYSLGITLWYLLTRQTPFRGTAADIIVGQLRETPPLAELPPLPPPVIELVQDLLAKDPAKRPQTAAQLEDRVEDLMRTLPVDSDLDEQEPASARETTSDEADPVAAPTLFRSNAFDQYLEPKVGQTREGRFLLVEKFREGLSGQLYRAREQRGSVEREVGLKFLHPGIAANAENQRFLRQQFDQLENIRSKNLMACYALELEACPRFMVREWLHGFSFQSLLRSKGSLTAQEVVWLLEPLPSLLDQLSSQGTLAMVEVSINKLFVTMPPNIPPERFADLAKTDLRKISGAGLKLNPLSLWGLLNKTDHVGSDVMMLSNNRLTALDQARVRVRGQTPVRLLGQVVYELLSGRSLPQVPSANTFRLPELNGAANQLLTAACVESSIPSPWPDCSSFWQTFQAAMPLANPARATPAPPIAPIHKQQAEIEAEAGIKAEQQSVEERHRPQPDEEQKQKRPYRVYVKAAWRLMPPLFFCYAIAYFHCFTSGLIGVGGMLGYVRTFDSDSLIAFALFFLGYLIFGVFSNVLLKKVGGRIWIAGMMIVGGVIWSASVLLKGSQLWVAQFLLGLTEAGLFSGIILYLTYWFPSRHLGRIFAWLMASTLLSWIVVAWLCYLIVPEQTSSVIAPVVAGVMIVIGVWVALTLPNRIGTAHWLTPSEKQTLEGDVNAKNAVEGQRRLVGLLIDPKVLILSLTYFSACLGLYFLEGNALFAWPEGFLANNLWLSVVLGGIAAAGMVLFATKSDRARERRLYYFYASLLGAVGLISLGLPIPGMFSQSPSFVVVLALAISFIGVLSLFPIFWTISTEILPRENTAAGIAWINVLGGSAFFWGPLIREWLFWFRSIQGFWIFGIAILAGGIMLNAVASAKNGATEPSKVE